MHYRWKNALTHTSVWNNSTNKANNFQEPESADTEWKDLEKNGELNL